VSRSFKKKKKRNRRGEKASHKKFMQNEKIQSRSYGSTPGIEKKKKKKKWWCGYEAGAARPFRLFEE